MLGAGGRDPRPDAANPPRGTVEVDAVDGPAYRAVRRRDRHGRGLRGPLVTRSTLAPRGVPLRRTPTQRFDDVVLDAVERVERRLPGRLDDVDFAVEDVPDVDARPAAAAGRSPDPLAEGIPLGALLRQSDRSDPGEQADPGVRIVLYRRPIELRAEGREEVEALVRDVLLEQVADLLNLAPEDIDPEYGLM